MQFLNWDFLRAPFNRKAPLTKTVSKSCSKTSLVNFDDLTGDISCGTDLWCTFYNYDVGYREGCGVPLPPSGFFNYLPKSKILSTGSHMNTQIEETETYHIEIFLSTLQKQKQIQKIVFCIEVWTTPPPSPKYWRWEPW